MDEIDDRIREVQDSLRQQWILSGSTRTTAHVKETIIEDWPELARLMEKLDHLSTMKHNYHRRNRT